MRIEGADASASAKLSSGEIRVAGNNIADTSSSSMNNYANNNSANIPGLNRNIHNHVGQTEGERANLKASIPISDIWEGLTTSSKPKEAPSAGDQPMSFGDYVEAFFNKIISPFVKEKEPETKIEIKNKLSSLDEQILVNISKDSEKAPVINNAIDREILNNIKAEVERKHPGKAEVDKQKLINLSYNLLKNFQSGVYTPPPVQVAAAALTPGMFGPSIASAVAIAGTALVTIGEVAVAVAAANPVTVGAVVAGVGGYYLYNAFLKNDKAQEYNQLHTKLANGDYLSSAENNSNYDINNDDDRIGIFDKKKHGNVDPKQKGKFKDSASVVASATGMPEPDDEGEEKKEKEFTYSDADYHHQNSSGLKSKPPTRGAKILEESIQVKSSSPRRIGIDKANNEIVIFDKTQGNIYHGHVRTWKELNQEQQNALIRENLTKLNGKFK